MRAKLKLDDKITRKNRKVGHFKSKLQEVNTTLAEYVGRQRRMRILELGGTIDFDPKWEYKRMRRLLP